MTLVPSEHTATTPGTAELFGELLRAKEAGQRRFEIEKFIGFDRNGRPDYPKVILRAELGSYGQPTASVSIRRTSTAYDDFIGSLRDLDVRVACEYYIKLDSVLALDAIEKVLRAPTPKAIALIALLDQLGLGRPAPTPASPQPAQIANDNQKVIDV